MTRLAAAIRPQPVVSGTATRSLRMTSLRPETDQFAVLLTRELSTRKRVVLLTSVRPRLAGRSRSSQPPATVWAGHGGGQHVVSAPGGRCR